MSGLDSKPWWLSKTIVASIVGILAALLRQLGIEVGDAEATQVALDLISAGSAVVAIYGRATAKRSIGKAAGSGGQLVELDPAREARARDQGLRTQGPGGAPPA